MNLSLGLVALRFHGIAVCWLYLNRAYHLVGTIPMDNAARMANILHMGSVNAS